MHSFFGRLPYICLLARPPTAETVPLALTMIPDLLIPRTFVLSARPAQYGDTLSFDTKPERRADLMLVSVRWMQPLPRSEFYWHAIAKNVTVGTSIPIDPVLSMHEVLMRLSLRRHRRLHSSLHPEELLRGALCESRRWTPVILGRRVAPLTC